MRDQLNAWCKSSPNGLTLSLVMLWTVNNSVVLTESITGTEETFQHVSPQPNAGASHASHYLTKALPVFFIPGCRSIYSSRRRWSQLPYHFFMCNSGNPTPLRMHSLCSPNLKQHPSRERHVRTSIQEELSRSDAVVSVSPQFVIWCNTCDEYHDMELT